MTDCTTEKRGLAERARPGPERAPDSNVGSVVMQFASTTKTSYGSWDHCGAVTPDRSRSERLRVTRRRSF